MRTAVVQNSKLHILLADNCNCYGGIAAMTVWLANGMAERGHKVTLCNQKPIPRMLRPLHPLWRALVRAAADPDILPPFPRGPHAVWDLYKLHPGISKIQYNFTDKNLHIQKFRQRLKSLHADVCLPMFGDSRQLVWAVTLLGTGIPYLYTELCSPRLMETLFWSHKGRLAAMSGADRIHLLSEQAAEDLPPFLTERVRCIANPIPMAPGRADVEGQKNERLKLLWIGRFEFYKQWKLMMLAFDDIADRFPQWELHMVGSGEELTAARRLHATLHASDRIILHGHVRDTAPYYAAAQLFCISSYAEGQPTTLMEAQAWGLPCVGFEDCDGVASLIQNGQTGELAWPMTAQALGDTLAFLMEDSELRRHMQERLLTTLSPDRNRQALDAWEALFKETAACKGQTVMDAFSAEPFASQARLSSVARREWLYRDFGKPMPESVEGWLWGLKELIKKRIKKALA